MERLLLFETELERIAQEIVLAYKDVLAEQDKIATGKTEKSIRAQVDMSPYGVSIFGSEGMYMIEKGREAFEVLLEDDDPDLLEWMDARNIPREAVTAIAMSIYFNPLASVPITGTVVSERLDAILRQSKLTNAIATDAAQLLRNAFELAFQNSKTP